MMEDAQYLFYKDDSCNIAKRKSPNRILQKILIFLMQGECSQYGIILSMTYRMKHMEHNCL